MDTLPGLILEEVLSYLDFKDRIKCALVCRSWRSKIRCNRGQERLFLHFSNLFPFNIKCPISGELIRYEDSVQLRSFKFLTSSMWRVYFSLNLRKLHIFNIEQFEINVPNLGVCLNSFGRLEQLTLTKLRLNEKTTLNLQKLQVLVMKHVTIDQQLDLNCNLQTLICWSDLGKIQLRYPHKLLHLEVKSNASLELHQHFPNLVMLSYYSHSGLTRSDFLEHMRQLRQLVIYSPFIESDLKELNRQKRQFQLNQLQILSFGFAENTSSSEKFTYFPINSHFIFLLDQFKLKELATNYNKLNVKVNYPLQLDFCSLDEQFQRIPADFHQKFTQISQLNVCWNSNELIEDHRPLISFIRACGFLPKLVLNNCSFRQSFFELLADCSSIGQLEIKENRKLDIFNYQFFQRSLIFHLKIALDRLPFELLVNVLKNPNIKYFEFHRKNFQMQIKHHPNHFHLDINRRFIHSFISLHSLLLNLKKNDEMADLLSY